MGFLLYRGPLVTDNIAMSDIAYIDDNKECLEIVKDAFDDINISIDIFDDPIQFYNINKEYKLVISDFDMPNLNGQEFLKLLKEKYPKIKTVIYSGMVDQIEELNLQVDTFLFKPLEFESLMKVVKFLLYEYEKENVSA